MMVLGRLLPLGLAWAGLIARGFGDQSPISFEERPGAVYDTKPKLKIRGTGFSQFSPEDLSNLKFDPPEVAVGGGGGAADGEKLFGVVLKADDTIVVEREPGTKWAESNGVLRLVEASLGGKALINTPITVATIVPTPTVYPSNKMLYLTKSPWVMVNGTNFDLKTTGLFFSPPLVEGEDIHTVVKDSNTIWVSLVQKNEVTRWANEPGPLKLVAIDTGAGKILLREDLGGITIAEMQADMKGHSISVENHLQHKMYQSTKVLTIAGTGFNPDHTKFRFGNSLFEEKNYTSNIEDYSATLTLKEGSKWKLNGAALPDKLVLLAADAGDGFVPLGSTLAKSGLQVATIFEDPKLEESYAEIGRTLTHELYLKGSGFTKKFPPMIVFDPSIEKDHFMVQVMNRTCLKVSLSGEGQGWMDDEATGLLRVRVINTGGGMFQFDQPVPVATVVADNQPHRSGIKLSADHGTQLYQSGSRPLYIQGAGFPVGIEPELTFGYGGPAQDTFSCKTVSESQIEVTLMDGHLWAGLSGPLFLREAKFGEDDVDYSSPGLKVATILDDPMVKASELHVYASHTKHITIQGQGFMSAYNTHFKPQVVLSPTQPQDFFIRDESFTDLTITLFLSQEHGAKWADVRSETERTAIKVVSIDTGGGPVIMPGGGVVIAEVQQDDASFSCEDSCVYANDGECDERQGSEDGGSWMSETNGESSITLITSQASASRGNYFSDPGVLSGDDFNAETPSCPLGTDCSDCGFGLTADGACSNTCKFARDGVCDDRRALGVCDDGTDCQDCGPWNHSNYTLAISESFSEETYTDDDTSGFLADSNHPLIAGQAGNALGRYKRVFVKHAVIRQESDKAEGLFMESLWAAIVLVGGSVVVYLMVLIVRCAKGEQVELPIPTNPDVEGSRR